MEIFLYSETWVALLTLTFLEIVLGVDNIIFISIVAGKLPEKDQAKARTIGLVLALVLRVGMLFGITWLIGFTQPLFSILSFDFSGKDVILALGGLFLLFKSTTEIHHKMEGLESSSEAKTTSSISMAIVQIILLDLVFSFDSILTAVGLTRDIPIMIIAVIVAVGVMIAFAGKISDFVNKHPTLQILALSFLILIGFMLMIEAFGIHVPKGYIYFAVAFSLVVEIVNMRIRRKKTDPVKLHKRMKE